MNKFINTETGGLDLFHDDIRWNDEAYRGAFFGILKAFNIGTNENFIISGCEVTDNTTDIDIASGYVYLNEELLQVDAQNVVDTEGNGLYALVKSVTYDATGDRTTKDGTSVQPYQKNRAVGQSSASGAATNQLDPVSGDTLRAKILQTTLDEGEANAGETKSQSTSNKIVTPNSLSAALDSLNRSKIEIGSWDMDTDLTKDVDISSLGLTSEEIWGITVLIRNDSTLGAAGSLLTPLDYLDNGSYRIDLENDLAELQRTASGVFDNANFDDTTINRGYIIIEWTRSS